MWRPSNMLFLLALTWSTPQRGEGKECDLNTRVLRSMDQFGFSLGVNILSPDRKKLAFQTNGWDLSNSKTSIWDLESNREVQAIPFGGFTLWSPDGTRLLIIQQSSSPIIVAANNGTFFMNLSGAPGSLENYADWSPDGSMIVTAHNGSCQIWNTSSWELVHGPWECGDGIPQWGLGPQSLIALTAGSIVHFFHPNGTIFSDVTLPVTKNYALWGPNSSLVIVALAVIGVFTPDGTALALTSISDDPGDVDFGVAWSPSGLLLACGTDRGVEIRSSVTLDLVFLLEAAPKHDIIGFINETALLTYSLILQKVFMWNIHISAYAIPSQSCLPSRHLAIWVDSDHILCVNLAEELNVRTLQWTPYTDPPYVSFCIMKGRIYSVSPNGTILITLHGKSTGGGWETQIPNSTIYCSSNSTIATSSGETIYVWSDSGRLLSTIKTGMTIEMVSLANEFLVGFVAGFDQFYIWNFSTSLPRQFNHCQQGIWSPTGNWIACEDGIYDPQDMLLFLYPTRVDSLLWSDDGSFIQLYESGFPPKLYWYNPKLGVQFDIIGGNANPTTMDLITTDKKGYIATPSLLRLDIGKVSQLTTVNATVAGARLLAASTRTMLRWVDTSTSVPQCLFLNGIISDAYTWISEPITLTAPGFYDLYFEYPTLVSSPWVGSEEASFNVECSGGSVPTINTTGGPTICACPNRFYATSLNDLECHECPSHGWCDGSAMILSEPGYLPMVLDPTQFRPCASGACPGNNRCSKYYHGPICGLCQPGAGQYGFGQCEPCGKTGAAAVLLVFGIFCWIGLCAVQSAFALGWRNDPKKRNNSAELASVLLSTSQTIALLLSVNVDLQGFKTALEVDQATQSGGGIQSPLFSCLLISAGGSPGAVHYVRMALLLFIPPVTWCLLSIIRQVLLRCRGVQTSVNIVRVPTVVVVLSLQSALSTTLLQTLSCAELNSEGLGYRLSHDISVVCYDRTYWLVVVFITIPGLITVILTPLALFWLLRFRPTENGSGYLKFLVKSHRKDWWFLVIFFRKFLQVIIVTQTRNAFDLATCLVLFSLIHIMVNPSNSLLVYLCEAVSLVVSAFIFSAMGGLSYTSDTAETYKSASSLLILVGVISYAIQVALLVLDRAKKQNNDKENIELEPIEPRSRNEKDLDTTQL